MVLIQVDLSEEENKKLRLYMIEKDLTTKSQAIKDIIQKYEG